MFTSNHSAHVAKTNHGGFHYMIYLLLETMLIVSRRWHNGHTPTTNEEWVTRHNQMKEDAKLVLADIEKYISIRVADGDTPTYGDVAEYIVRCMRVCIGHLARTYCTAQHELFARAILEYSMHDGYCMNCPEGLECIDVIETDDVNVANAVVPYADIRNFETKAVLPFTYKGKSYFVIVWHMGND
jgi:hypothetical protein